MQGIRRNGQEVPTNLREFVELCDAMISRADWTLERCPHLLPEVRAATRLRSGAVALRAVAENVRTGRDRDVSGLPVLRDEYVNSVAAEPSPTVKRADGHLARYANLLIRLTETRNR